MTPEDGSPSIGSHVPIVCDMTAAPDNAHERLAEYRRLFETALIRRERTATSMRWLLSDDSGVEAWAKDLAARENTCCAFMKNTVTLEAGMVVWEATTVDDPVARAVLDLFYELPDRLADGVEALHERLANAGIGWS